MKAKRMLAIVAIAFAILCGFAFASAKAQTNGFIVKPDEKKRLVLGEGGTQKIYCDSSQVGAYSISAKSYNGGPGYDTLFCPPVYVNVYHSKDRKAWRWIDFVVVETFSHTGLEHGDEQKFFFSRKIDGFYCLELSHAFDSIPGSRTGKVSAVLKTFSWKSLVGDIDAAIKVENPDGFSEEKMKLNDLGADYIDQATKLNVLLRIAAESISTNPARICYAKYLPAKGDEADSDLVKYKNLFYVKALAGSAASFANSLQREPAFRAYAEDPSKAADELKKMIDKWQLEQKRQLPRSRLTMPPDRIFQETAEAMRKVAACVEVVSEAMKSNLVLAEAGQVRRFSPLLARELAVPLIEQSGENCAKTAELVGIKYFQPDLSIDESWLDPVNLMDGGNMQISSILRSANLRCSWRTSQRYGFDSMTNKDNWFDILKESIIHGYPIEASFHTYAALPWRGAYGTYEKVRRHGLIIRGFGSDGSVILNENAGGNRFVVSKETFRSIEKFSGLSVCPLEKISDQTSSVSTAKDDTLALEKK